MGIGTPAERSPMHGVIRTAGWCAAALVLGGCATKSDIRMLRTELIAMQQRQDSVYREAQRQNRLLLDTLRTSFDLQRDLRGETSHRFAQLEQNLGRLEELISQQQLVAAQLLERLDRGGPLPGAVRSPGRGGGGGEAEAIYQSGLQRLGEGSYATARAAFTMLLEQYPEDPRAPEAQYGLAEAYAGERDVDRAIEEFEKVERQWPQSERAPVALLRAGILAQESNRRDRARQFFTQLRQRYPNSDAATEAERRLRSLR
jgi:tol-pal system protein YbgF